MHDDDDKKEDIPKGQAKVSNLHQKRAVSILGVGRHKHVASCEIAMHNLATGHQHTSQAKCSTTTAHVLGGQELHACRTLCTHVNEIVVVQQRVSLDSCCCCFEVVLEVTVAHKLNKQADGLRQHARGLERNNITMCALKCAKLFHHLHLKEELLDLILICTVLPQLLDSNLDILSVTRELRLEDAEKDFPKVARANLFGHCARVSQQS